MKNDQFTLYRCISGAARPICRSENRLGLGLGDTIVRWCNAWCSAAACRFSMERGKGPHATRRTDHTLVLDLVNHTWSRYDLNLNIPSSRFCNITITVTLPYNFHLQKYTSGPINVFLFFFSLSFDMVTRSPR